MVDSYMKTTLVIPDQMHARLELQTRRNGMNVSEVIRSAVDFYLNYQDSFYDDETLKPPTGNGQSIPPPQILEKTNEGFKAWNPETFRDSKPIPSSYPPQPPISPEDRQARIDRLIKSGDKPVGKR